MCGIAGLLARPGRVPERVPAAEVAASLAHRGPDDRGLLTWSRQQPHALTLDAWDRQAADLTLIHTRLAILDPSPQSRQPMVSPCGRFALCFNGEIFNYLELRADLSATGHCFRTTGDTEVALAAYVEWGAQAIERFDGMFALAIVDLAKHRLVLARDFAGIKPLFYTWTHDTIAFASELNALWPLTGTRPRADAASVHDYLAFGLTDHQPSTMFAGVQHLPPGHITTIDLDNPEPRPPTSYWTPPTEVDEHVRFGDAAAEIRELLVESVRLRLRSDASVGMTLSGGIDSSAIACAAGRHAGHELRLYSYEADDPELSERTWVEQVARHLGATPHWERLSAAELWEDLDDLLATQDEPFTSTSIYAQYRLFRRMHDDGVKVALGGQGADEIFGGYPSFLQRLFMARFLRGDLMGAGGLLIGGRRIPGFPTRRLATFLARETQARTSRLTRWFWSRPVVVPRVNRPDVRLDRQWLAGAELAERAAEEPASVHALLTNAFVRSSLPRLLRYEDRNAMRFSVENRVPFVSRRLVDRALSLPARFLISNTGSTKHVLRTALRGLVPASILRRRDKIGFATPEQAVLTANADRLSSLFNETTTDECPCLDLHGIRSDWQKIRHGDLAFDARVWRWMCFILWARRHAVTFVD